MFLFAQRILDFNFTKSSIRGMIGVGQKNFWGLSNFNF